MRVIVAGSRGFGALDYPLVEEVCLTSGYWFTTILSGGAAGVDRLGEQFARNINAPVEQFLANWKRYGRSAGPRRNEEMARRAEALVAVWDGKSSGTAHMISTARARGLLVYVRIAAPAQVKAGNHEQEL